MRWLLRNLAAVAMLFVSGLAVSALTTLIWYQEKAVQARVEIEAAHSELELAFATLSLRMSSIATAMEQSDDRSPQTFAMLYSGLSGGSIRTHERALAFMPALTQKDSLERLLKRWKTDYQVASYPEFSLFPDTDSAPLYPALMVEPQAARHAVFGYNMGSSPERVAAAMAALEASTMMLSAPVSLSQDSDTSRASFLLLYPVRLPEPDAEGGYVTALLGAGVTPAALFSEHVSLYERHIVEVKMGISGSDLSVDLQRSEQTSPFALTLVRDFEMPAIQTEGFAVPFSASVFYIPRLSDLTVPLATGLITAVIVGLFLNLMAVRASNRRALTEALKAKEQELGEMYRYQARSQRAEALGRLVGGVAHDFNNILSVILGNLELLGANRKTEDEQELISDAIGATQRGAHLTRQLLSVGRRSHLQPRSLDVSETVLDAAKLIQRVLPESMSIETSFPAQDLKVSADRNGLQHALLNLAINARDAMQGQGRMLIKAIPYQVSTTEAERDPDDGLKPGPYVRISVSDTGPGMQSEVLERAFEPFYTTKHLTEGSGLGLSSVQGFCRQSGGGCRIESVPGVGTSVHLLLPIAETPGFLDEGDAVSPPAKQASGRILLAEDEAAVAQVIRKHLENAGYFVRHVSTGDAAWALLEEGFKCDLILSDLVMPGDLQGLDLAEQVAATYPDVRVLLISGYPQDPTSDHTGCSGRFRTMTKPIRKQDLLETVSQLLYPAD